MSSTPLVTPNAIRAALGVSDIEIGDSAIEDQMVDDALLAELDTVCPRHEKIRADAAHENASAEQRALDRLLRLYALWYCAASVAENWLAIPNRISDGQAAMSRALTTDMLTQITERAAARRDHWQFRLEAAMTRAEGSEQGETATFGLASISSPGYDPVTNQ